jgi:hypothetical protein
LLTLDLLLSAPFYLLKHFKTLALFLHKHLVCFLLCLRNLLVKYLVISVLKLRQVLNLSCNHPLARFLFLRKLLLLLIFAQLVHRQLLLRILLDFLFMLQLLQFLFFLEAAQFLVGALEALFLFFKGPAPLSFLFKLFFLIRIDLTFDEFTF